MPTVGPGPLLKFYKTARNVTRYRTDFRISLDLMTLNPSRLQKICVAQANSSDTRSEPRGEPTPRSLCVTEGRGSKHKECRTGVRGGGSVSSSTLQLRSPADLQGTSDASLLMRPIIAQQLVTPSYSVWSRHALVSMLQFSESPSKLPPYPTT